MALLCVQRLAWRTLQPRAISEEAIRRAPTGVRCNVPHDRGDARQRVLLSTVGDIAHRLRRVTGLTRQEVPFELTGTAWYH